MKPNEKYQTIFLTSHRLFLTQGYEATTIRQISRQADVSLGLTNHFFASKEVLAELILNVITSYCDFCCDAGRPHTDPLLHAALSVRVRTMFLLNSGYRSFYLDTLKYDIFPHKSEKTPSRVLYQLAALYHFPVDDDLFLLYGNYVPCSYEKSLILGKEAGLFSTIPADQIPDYITISSFEHFLDQRILNQALLDACDAAQSILKRMPALVSDDFLLDFLEEHHS